MLSKAIENPGSLGGYFLRVPGPAMITEDQETQAVSISTEPDQRFTILVSLGELFLGIYKLIEIQAEPPTLRWAHAGTGDETL